MVIALYLCWREGRGDGGEVEERGGERGKEEKDGGEKEEGEKEGGEKDGGERGSEGRGRFGVR